MSYICCVLLFLTRLWLPLQLIVVKCLMTSMDSCEYIIFPSVSRAERYMLLEKFKVGERDDDDVIKQFERREGRRRSSCRRLDSVFSWKRCLYSFVSTCRRVAPIIQLLLNNITQLDSEKSRLKKLSNAKGEAVEWLQHFDFVRFYSILIRIHFFTSLFFLQSVRKHMVRLKVVLCIMHYYILSAIEAECWKKN